MRVSFVLIRGLLMASWMVACHQKDQAMTKSLEFSAPYHSLEKGKGLEMVLINHTYVRNPL